MKIVNHDSIIDQINDTSIISESNKFYNLAKYVFGCDQYNKPSVTDGEIIFKMIKLIEENNIEKCKSFINERLIDGSTKRYKTMIEPFMKKIDNTEFMMGSSLDNIFAYCGEFPEHKVKVDDFYICSIVITNEMYKRFNPNYEFNNGNKCPATNISWYDASVFAMWVDCRLPTEAEWELASGRIISTEWCCIESELSEYGWHSENSDGYVHEVGKLKPNIYGLYDMYGNIWEWTSDSYDEKFYEISPVKNPINETENGLKVCRGGSIQGFSEMCRSAFRYYEPINFKASDLGFRLAKNREEII